MAIARNGKRDGDPTKTTLQLPDFFSGYRRDRFSRECSKDGNATRAAREAGYSEHTAKSQDSRLLTFVDIQRRLDELAMGAVTSARVTTDYVRARLRGLVEVAIGNEAVPTGEKSHYDPNLAARALERLGKTTGAFVDRSQVVTDNKIEVTIRTVHGPEAESGETVTVETFDVSPTVALNTLKTKD